MWVFIFIGDFGERQTGQLNDVSQREVIQYIIPSIRHRVIHNDNLSPRNSV